MSIEKPSNLFVAFLTVQCFISLKLFFFAKLIKNTNNFDKNSQYFALKMWRNNFIFPVLL